MLRRNGYAYSRYYEDLLQEARIAFLMHLRTMDDITQVFLCTLTILNAMFRFLVEMNFISIPRDKFTKVIGDFKCVSLDHDPLPDLLVSEEEVTSQAVLEDFLSRLTDQERIAICMRMDGYNNRAIMPRVGLTTDVQMTRLMKRIGKKAEAYFAA